MQKRQILLWGCKMFTTLLPDQNSLRAAVNLQLRVRPPGHFQCRQHAHPWLVQAWRCLRVSIRICMRACSVVVWLLVTPWTLAHQAPLTREFPGKNTGECCHFLLQGIFPTQGSNSHLLRWQADSLPQSHQGCSRVSVDNSNFLPTVSGLGLIYCIILFKIYWFCK